MFVMYISFITHYLHTIAVRIRPSFLYPSPTLILCVGGRQGCEDRLKERKRVLSPRCLLAHWCPSLQPLMLGSVVLGRRACRKECVLTLNCLCWRRLLAFFGACRRKLAVYVFCSSLLLSRILFSLLVMLHSSILLLYTFLSLRPLLFYFFSHLFGLSFLGWG